MIPTTGSSGYTKSVEEEFIDAVRIGDINKVIGFIDEGVVDITLNDELGELALREAIQNGDLPMVRALWRRNAWLRDEDGRTVVFSEVLRRTLYFRAFREYTARFIQNIIGVGKKTKAE